MPLQLRATGPGPRDPVRLDYPDAASSAAFGVDEVAGAYADWSGEMGSSPSAWNDWHVPLRPAMWLWPITWRAKWRVAARPRGSSGEDWSIDLSEPALIAHVRGRVDHYLSTAIVEQVLGEIDAHAQTLSNTDDQDNVIIESDRP